jgi:hypothetical protein
MTREPDHRPFAVGVVGHRPNRLPADQRALAKALGGMLAAVRDAVVSRMSQTRPVGVPAVVQMLCAVSPLAEGADRLFAEQALELGFALRCPMPFPQEEYERDFAPGIAFEARSLQRFRGLLDRAARTTGLAVVELPGSRMDVDGAYAAAGSAVLDASDVLVAVWDGTRGSSPAGTEATMEAARRRGIPLVVVGANAPHVATGIGTESSGSLGETRPDAWKPISPDEVSALVADALARRK